MSNNDSSLIEILTKRGYRCKNCGITGEEHPKFHYYQNHSSEDGKRKTVFCSKRFRGYKYSRKDCPGFENSKKDLKEIILLEKLEEKEKEEIKKTEKAFLEMLDYMEKVNDAIGKHW